MVAHVYIMTNESHRVFYIGVTTHIARRSYEHKTGAIEGFSKKYKTTKLVYAEETFNVLDAIEREKCIKRWKRQWKIDLINTHNPQWHDLYNTLL
jgi:putative endonuclease